MFPSSFLPSVPSPLFHHSFLPSFLSYQLTLLLSALNVFLLSFIPPYPLSAPSFPFLFPYCSPTFSPSFFPSSFLPSCPPSSLTSFLLTSLLTSYSRTVLVYSPRLGRTQCRRCRLQQRPQDLGQSQAFCQRTHDAEGGSAPKNPRGAR